MSNSRYDHLSHEALIALLERRDARRTYGLVWEREGIEPDLAVNDDFVALDLHPELSTRPLDPRGWRNLIIEGDNWDALRALRLAYVGRVKCILIDPPYNTGNRDFTYNDHFVGTKDRYRQSMWLEFLYRRLVVARDLLSEDGVILVCINDENRARLDLLMEQIFPGMRLGSFVWRTKDTNNSDKRRNWSGVHEHILIYANPGFGFIGPDAGPGKFRLRPQFGDVPVRLDPITKGGTFKSRENTYYPIQDPKTGLWYPCAPSQVWRFWSEEEVKRQQAERKLQSEPESSKRKVARPGAGPSIESFIRANEIYFPPQPGPPFFYEDRAALDAAIEAGNVPRDGKGRPLLRPDLPRLDFWVGKPIAHGRLNRIVKKTAADDEARRPVGSWIAGLNELVPDDVQTLRSDRQGVASTEIEHLFGEQAFTFPKPSSLIRSLVRATVGEDEWVLDFFAGSGTTGAAALALNAEDDADRRFILVSNTEASAAQPTTNLCRDVCAVRLRKVIDGFGDSEPVAGDFAYLHTRRIAWDDALYDMDDAAIWNLLQLRHDRPLLPLNSITPLQISRGNPNRVEEPVLAFLPQVTDEAIEELRQLASLGPLIAFTRVPAQLRDALALPSVPIEQVPDRLLADFPQNALGL